VSTEFESSSSMPSSLSELTAPPESAAFASLRARVADTLHHQARDIAGRWEAQARSAALRDRRRAGAAAQGTDAASLVQAIAATLGSEGAAADSIVAIGVAFGAEAFNGGMALHHTLKAVDLLVAMTLYALEGAVAQSDEGTAGAADGVRLCRRLQHASSLLGLAVAKGHAQALSGEMRDRFRHLRHDLRNPLGTIKSVLALMDDETVPADARSNPRFRAMADRNARSLDELIADRLSDAAAATSTAEFQRVSLRAIACEVRRDLRDEAAARQVSVVVAPDVTELRIDGVGFELLLHEILIAVLHEARRGDEVTIAFGLRDRGRVTISVACAPARTPISESAPLERLAALAKRMGASLDVSRGFSFSLPIQGEERDSAAAPAAAPSAGGEPRDDVRGAHEREHGQPGAL
jgi:signal transduction histidine kinase